MASARLFFGRLEDYRHRVTSAGRTGNPAGSAGTASALHQIASQALCVLALPPAERPGAGRRGGGPCLLGTIDKEVVRIQVNSLGERYGCPQVGTCRAKG